MTPATFDAHKGSPQGMLRRETLARDQSGPLSGGVPTSDLGGKRQEQFISSSFYTTFVPESQEIS